MICKSTESDLEASITYYKDKESFEQNHLKIIHPPIFITIVKGEFKLQSEEGLKQSYRSEKTTVSDEEKVKKVSFIPVWINDENIRKYEMTRILENMRV